MPPLLVGGRDAAAPAGFYEGGGVFRSEGRFPIARRERRFLVASCSGGVVVWRRKRGGGTIVPPRSPLFGGRDAAAPAGFYEGGRGVSIGGAISNRPLEGRFLAALYSFAGSAVSSRPVFPTARRTAPGGSGVFHAPTGTGVFPGAPILRQEGRFPVARREGRVLVASGSGGMRDLGEKRGGGTIVPPRSPLFGGRDAAAPAGFYECGKRFGDLFAMTSAT